MTYRRQLRLPKPCTGLQILTAVREVSNFYYHEGKRVKNKNIPDNEVDVVTGRALEYAIGHNHCNPRFGIQILLDGDPWFSTDKTYKVITFREHVFDVGAKLTLKPGAITSGDVQINLDKYKQAIRELLCPE